MRLLPLLAASLVSLPLAAQTPEIAPARSVLFVPATTAPRSETQGDDPVFHQDARTVGVGLGIIAGSAVVYVLSKSLHAGACTDIAPSDCPGRWHPGVGGYLVGMATGGVVGYLIGDALHSDPAPQ